MRRAAAAGLAIGLTLGVQIPVAQAAPVRTAVVLKVTGTGDIRVKRPRVTSVPIISQQSLYNRDSIIVPAETASRATLKATSGGLTAELVGLSTRAIWRLPCTFSGGGFISWTAGDDRGCSPPGVVIRADEDDNQAQAPTSGVLLASRAITPGLAQGLFGPIRTCSAMAADGTGVSTKVYPGIDPCDDAVAACEQATGSGSCLVVSEGEWRDRSSAFTVCDGQLRRLSVSESGISRFLGLALSVLGQQGNCVVHVLSRNDLLLTPDSAQPTAIAFVGGPGGVAVTVLEGAVRVVSARSSGWEPLPAGATIVTGRRMEDRTDAGRGDRGQLQAALCGYPQTTQAGRPMVLTSATAGDDPSPSARFCRN